MLFAALWLFEIPTLIGGFASIVFALIAFAGTLYFLIKDAPLFSWPSKAQIDRRIEQQNRLIHRPLSNLNDKPVSRHDLELWRRERDRLKALLRGLKPASPHIELAEKDPKAIRWGIVLAVFCGLIVAGPNSLPRIQKGLFPFTAPAFITDEQLSYSLWITPPEYTGIDRIVLNDENANSAFKIPKGSVLEVTVQKQAMNIFGPPTLSFDAERVELPHSGQDAFTLKTDVPEAEIIVLKTSPFHSQSWHLAYTDDMPPTLELVGAAETLSDGTLQFNIKMRDDYGVKSLEMSMNLDPVVTDAPVGEPVTITRSVLSPADTDFQMSPVYDLSAHPWAGLPAHITFKAIDHTGKSATSDRVEVILPERQFTHPVAKKLIELRKYLAWNPESEMRDTVIALEGLMSLPHSYGGDTRAFLAMRVASARLYYNEPSIKNTQSVMSLLWDTALKLEDGNLSLAARTLRDAQDALEKALNNPESSDAEIAQAMQDVREALSEYLQAMAREMQQNMQMSPDMHDLPPEMLSNMMDLNDFADMLDRMESQALSGDRSSAQQMLSQLQRMMDMLNPSLAQQGQMSMPQDMQMMREGINELQELIERQEALKDQTEKQAELMRILEGMDIKSSETRNTPFVDTAENKTEQEALRMVLGQLMLDANEALDEIPEQLGMAEQEMRNSSNALEGSRPDQSVPYQEKVLEYLKGAQQQMMQQLAQRMQQMTGFSIGMPQRYDPLGRPMGQDNGGNNSGLGSEVEVPGQSQKKWVQDILEELRRRSGDRSRPQEELEYYRRLLKRF